ncbi:MAG: hypothetical protein LOD91_05980, partial [Limnochordales bacterium]
LRQVAGLLPLAAGELRLEGATPEETLPELCHYIGHLSAVKASLSVSENLRFWSDFLGGENDPEKGLAAFGHGRGDVERRIALGDPRLGPAVSINRFAARPAPRGSGCRWRSG